MMADPKDDINYEVDLKKTATANIFNTLWLSVYIYAGIKFTFAVTPAIDRLGEPGLIIVLMIVYMHAFMRIITHPPLPETFYRPVSPPDKGNQDE